METINLILTREELYVMCNMLSVENAKAAAKEPMPLTTKDKLMLDILSYMEDIPEDEIPDDIKERRRQTEAVVKLRTGGDEYMLQVAKKLDILAKEHNCKNVLSALKIRDVKEEA